MKISFQPRLVAISDASTRGAAHTVARFGELAEAAAPGSLCVQLRDPDLSGASKLELGRKLAALCRIHGQWLSVNDRLDLALELGAHALHLPEQGIATSEARRLFARQRRRVAISRACHDPSALPRVDADAVIVSPALQARKGRAALGLAPMRALAEALGKRADAPRLVALGGVEPRDASALLAAGCHGVAVQGAAYEADVTALLRALGCLRRLGAESSAGEAPSGP